MKGFLVGVTFKKAARLSDGSVNLTFQTVKEATSEEVKTYDEHWMHDGVIAFKKDEASVADMPDISGIRDEKGSSPAQNLKSALWRKYTSDGRQPNKFPEYYESVMNGFIETVEEKINDGKA